ncbi:MAG: beta-ketoacyl-ACP synthase [Holophagaceae bacterium]|nr:beta-ketoacyl-ACP synthase [Holophagaceae bacterium]
MTLSLYIQAFSQITCLEDDLKGILTKDQSGMILRDDIVFGRSLRFGTIRADMLPQIPEGFSNLACNRLTLYCLSELKNEIDELLDRYGKHRVGVIVGSSNAGILETQAAAQAFVDHGRFPDWFGTQVLDMGLPSNFIAEYTGIAGPAYTISTACTSSAKAFKVACRLIDAGACDAVIAGGIDPLATFACNGFYALEALSEGYSNPLSKNRDGITIGEAGALFIVSREKSGFCIAGIGETSDAHHMTAPSPYGEYAAEAMRLALQEAGIKPQDIGYVNLHGTGTKHNDAAESRAVYDVFGGDVPCSSSKPIIGHTLGASGAAELAHCCLLLDRRLNPEKKIPPHPWDGSIDNDIAPIHISDGSSVLDMKYVISNSFAFGGSNVSMVLRCEA